MSIFSYFHIVLKIIPPPLGSSRHPRPVYKYYLFLIQVYLWTRVQELLDYCWCGLQGPKVQLPQPLRGFGTTD